jgi:hypothetical protein
MAWEMSDSVVGRTMREGRGVLRDEVDQRWVVSQVVKAASPGRRSWAEVEREAARDWVSGGGEVGGGEWYCSQ